MNITMTQMSYFPEYAAVLNHIRKNYDEPNHELHFQDLKDELMSDDPNSHPKYHLNFKEKQ